jgi:hypothetical protein
MSPSTGEDTDYTFEWRLVEKPDDAGPEWMGNRWGIERTFTKGGEVQSKDLMETADTKEKVVKLLPTESAYQKAEKYGLAKAEAARRDKEKATKEAAEKAEQESERQAGERYEQRMKELGTRKGVTTGMISMAGVGEDWKTIERRDKPGLIIGKGIGVVIHDTGLGKRKTYTVTHLNTGKAMGHEWQSPKEAIALGKAVTELGDWGKYQEEKDVPKSMMNAAASLVRQFTARKLEAAPKPEPRAEAKAKPKREPKPKKEKEIGILKPKPAAKPQSDRALAIDRSLLAKNVVQSTDPRWLAQPNRYDVRGIDTPGSGRIGRTGFTDKGKTRLSRRHHRGWKKAQLA